MNSSQPKKSEFYCKKCGDCCRVFTLPVNNKEELIEKFKKSFGFSLNSYKFEVVVEGECEHLEGKSCSIYKDRPQVCQKYLCKNHNSSEHIGGGIYTKRCRVCKNLRKFQAGTERDKQSVCGECWVW